MRGSSGDGREQESPSSSGAPFQLVVAMQEGGGLVSAHFLPSSCREAMTWPITNEIMDAGVFCILRSRHLDSERGELKWGLNGVCKMTVAGHGLMPDYTMWFVDQQASPEGCLEMQSLRPYSRPKNQTLHFKIPQEVHVYISSCVL